MDAVLTSSGTSIDLSTRLYNLPKALVQNIFLRLDPLDIFELRRVSARLYCMVHDHEMEYCRARLNRQYAYGSKYSDLCNYSSSFAVPGDI